MVAAFSTHGVVHAVMCNVNYLVTHQSLQEDQLPQRNSASAAHVCAADALFLCGSCIGIGIDREMHRTSQNRSGCTISDIQTL